MCVQSPYREGELSKAPLWKGLGGLHGSTCREGTSYTHTHTYAHFSFFPKDMRVLHCRNFIKPFIEGAL